MADKPANVDEGTVPQTLEDGQILTRRSVLTAIGATIAGATATAINGCVVYDNTQPAQPVHAVGSGGSQVVVGQSGPTDGDGGQFADPVGHGRGGARAMQTGLTDSDGGPHADPGGQGRGHAGRGGGTGLTDSDGGPYADPAGGGRGTARLGNTGLTDSDGGPYADPAGHGRGHR